MDLGTAGLNILESGTKDSRINESGKRKLRID